MTDFKVFQIREDNSVAEMGMVAPPTGVYAIHVKRLEFPDLPARKVLIKIKVTVADVAKETEIYKPGMENLLVVDALFHFHVQPSCFANEISNRISVEMMEVIDGIGSWTVASLNLHLYDVMVQGQPMKEFYPIVNPLDDVMAMVELEMCFKYGIFGYGYSNQLQLDGEEANAIESSLFPRFNPLPSRHVNASGASSCEPVEEVVSLLLSKPTTIGSLPNAFDPSKFARQFKRSARLNHLVRKLNSQLMDLHGNFAKLNLRHDKVKFLRKLVNDQKV